MADSHNETLVPAVEEFGDPAEGALDELVGIGCTAAVQVDECFADKISRSTVETESRVEPVELDECTVGGRLPQVPNMSIDCVFNIGLCRCSKIWWLGWR